MDIKVGMILKRTRAGRQDGFYDSALIVSISDDEKMVSILFQESVGDRWRIDQVWDWVDCGAYTLEWD